MPPSGFIKKELKNLSGFTKSLLERFEQEVKSGIHESIEIGIENELIIINKHLENANSLEKGILLLSKNIYLEYRKNRDVKSILKKILSLQNKEYKN